MVTDEVTVVVVVTMVMVALSWWGVHGGDGNVNAFHVWLGGGTAAHSDYWLREKKNKNKRVKFYYLIILIFLNVFLADRKILKKRIYKIREIPFFIFLGVESIFHFYTFSQI